MIETNYTGQRDATARAAHAKRLRERRVKEQRDALHFALAGHDAHQDTCVYDEPCSRTYDPLPYRGTRGRDSETGAVRVTTRQQLALQGDERDYAGTGIGALYGLPGSEHHLWQLAGWNVAGLVTL